MSDSKSTIRPSFTDGKRPMILPPRLETFLTDMLFLQLAVVPGYGYYVNGLQLTMLGLTQTDRNKVKLSQLNIKKG
jgi:hypothetical protein